MNEYKIKQEISNILYNAVFDNEYEETKAIENLYILVEKIHNKTHKEQNKINSDENNHTNAFYQNNTTKIIKIEDDYFGNSITLDATECCKVNPITNENYCPNCGKKIIR